MNHRDDALMNDMVDVRNAQAASPVVIVCEHASAHIPQAFGDLGLAADALHSHVVWDPGAMAVATEMAALLDAALVASKTSRLVYDCNRPPEAPDAMPARSEIVDVPGNQGLSAAQRSDRVATYYTPFREALAAVIAARTAPILVTIHSFTPVYHGKTRDVEIGILHDSDARLADAMLGLAAHHTSRAVRRNEPYGPGDGVTHTLKEHALPHGYLNVMLEIRNDLIADEAAQTDMAATLAEWVSQALKQVEAKA
ncbi:N-formylglutamate amidohydrolase [Antarctobacter heliothermus]|uniref:Predicted N-formylglutamate amidohydrolase n=1 Tax=Antarctobacter heliothermus TaxID=74033 RepID=A0A239GFN8_9RHOB|nr:N-formylglutamate amidohydrolase [Antarctobacter heliothermus]SNS67959.1 Predicted N-formylglutamate amidohydrolase [Antarctobacter heliothermus]